MKSTKKLLLASAAVAICALPVCIMAESAIAKTVTTKTVVQHQEFPTDGRVEFSVFDLNNDHVLTMQEVGKKLFYIYDTDGNEVIDNNEFDNKKVVTIAPVQKNTYTFVDYDNDGHAEEATYTYETFLERSLLAEFDEDMDGLSAEDFIETSFLKLDDDGSKAIELEEWEEEYMARVKPENAEQERYN